jgi:uncharacterized coiled-coil protein SlyX
MQLLINVWREITMSDDLDQIRTRQDEFDARLVTLEETVAAQSTLRASMDQDLADIKALQGAQHGMLQAVGITLSDHTRRLDKMEGRLGNVEGRLDTVEEKLGNVLVGVHAIIAMLEPKDEGSL